MGSPHIRQVDGIGGGAPSPARSPDLAVDAARRRPRVSVCPGAVGEALVDIEPNCGNMLTAVGHSRSAGLVPASDPQTPSASSTSTRKARRSGRADARAAGDLCRRRAGRRRPGHRRTRRLNFHDGIGRSPEAIADRPSGRRHRRHRSELVDVASPTCSCAPRSSARRATNPAEGSTPTRRSSRAWKAPPKSRRAWGWATFEVRHAQVRARRAAAQGGTIATRYFVTEVPQGARRDRNAVPCFGLRHTRHDCLADREDAPRRRKACSKSSIRRARSRSISTPTSRTANRSCAVPR